MRILATLQEPDTGRASLGSTDVLRQRTTSVRCLAICRRILGSIPASRRESFEYYTRNFGPDPQKEARIIEFPRVASFAEGFEGTMPYSESIGFIANLEHQDDIDKVFYVVGHEMGHQWWAHQVIGANMQGATSLSETLAQYSALIVMEKEYGRDAMRKFMQ